MEKSIKCSESDEEENQTTNDHKFDQKYASTLTVSPRVYFCTMCPEGFYKASDRKSHLQTHFPDRKKFQCQSCPKSFLLERSLKINSMEKHNSEVSDVKPWKCDLCQKSFSRPGNLKNHKLVHIGDRKLICEFCQVALPQYWHLKEHLAGIHGQDVHFKCLKCNRKFHYKTNWLHHQCRRKKKPKGERVICRICGKSISAGHTRVHLRSHTGDKPFKCPSCDATFSQASNLKRHQKSRHEQRQLMDCELCSRKNLAQLANHIAQVHASEKLFQCPHCPKAFPMQRFLNSHLVRHQKKYQCEICGWLCSLDRELKEHMARHSGLRCFQCDQCRKAFSVKSDLKSHMKRNHSIETKFKCPHCPKSFALQGILNAHLHTHDKKHLCHICGFKCSFPSILKEHMSRHLGIRSFSCDHCDKKFVVKRDLMKHLRKTH